MRNVNGTTKQEKTRTLPVIKSALRKEEEKKNFPNVKKKKKKEKRLLFLLAIIPLTTLLLICILSCGKAVENFQIDQG